MSTYESVVCHIKWRRNHQSDGQDSFCVSVHKTGYKFVRYNNSYKYWLRQGAKRNKCCGTSSDECKCKQLHVQGVRAFSTIKFKVLQGSSIAIFKVFQGSSSAIFKVFQIRFSRVTFSPWFSFFKKTFSMSMVRLKLLRLFISKLKCSCVRMYTKVCAYCKLLCKTISK